MKTIKKAMYLTVIPGLIREKVQPTAFYKKNKRFIRPIARGTSSVLVYDKDGNAVSFTSSLNHL